MADRKKGTTVLFEESPKLHLTPRRRKPYGKQSRFISELMKHDLTVSPPNNDEQNRSLFCSSEMPILDFKKWLK